MVFTFASAMFVVAAIATRYEYEITCVKDYARAEYNNLFWIRYALIILFAFDTGMKLQTIANVVVGHEYLCVIGIVVVSVVILLLIHTQKTKYVVKMFVVIACLNPYVMLIKNICQLNPQSSIGSVFSIFIGSNVGAFVSNFNIVNVSSINNIVWIGVPIAKFILGFKIQEFLKSAANSYASDLVYCDLVILFKLIATVVCAFFAFLLFNCCFVFVGCVGCICCIVYYTTYDRVISLYENMIPSNASIALEYARNELIIHSSNTILRVFVKQHVLGFIGCDWMCSEIVAWGTYSMVMSMYYTYQIYSASIVVRDKLQQNSEKIAMVCAGAGVCGVVWMGLNKYYSTKSID